MCVCEGVCVCVSKTVRFNPNESYKYKYTLHIVNISHSVSNVSSSLATTYSIVHQATHCNIFCAELNLDFMSGTSVDSCRILKIVERILAVILFIVRRQRGCIKSRSI